MSPHEEFPDKRLEGAPSSDIGWHFGNLVRGQKGYVECKMCRRVLKGGITRLKEHLAHKSGNVAPCARVSSMFTVAL